MTTITLTGGLRDGQHFDVEFLGATLKAPGAYEDAIRSWRGDHFVYAFPTEVYTPSQDPGVYVYSHTEPPKLP